MPSSTLLFLQRWHSTSEIVATLRAYVVIGMIPYEALDKYFEFSPIDEVAHTIIQLARIEATNSYTTQVLYRLGFQWPPTAVDYVHRFVDTIIGFDYFTV